MLYYSHKLLDQEYANNLFKRLMSTGDWVDGLVSAKGSSVKRNIQLGAEEHSNFSSEIIELINNNDNIRYSVFPKKIHSILFTRTGPGMFYGPHVDLPMFLKVVETYLLLFS